MLSIKQLDDRLYEEILDKAKNMIPRIFPAWTDLRAHDPGVTFIEMLALLTEMQEYYLNRVTDNNKLKFLKLLNTDPLLPQPAQSNITFEEVQEKVVVPGGTRVFADNEPFETKASTCLQPLGIEAVIIEELGKAKLVYRQGGQVSISGFSAFGDFQKEGSSLNIGLNGLYDGGSIVIRIEIADLWAGRNQLPNRSDTISLVELQWEFFDSIKNVWEAVEPLFDETFGLLFSGEISFELPAETAKHKLEWIDDQLYWIRCKLIKPGYEIVPRIKTMLVNSIGVIHGKTMSNGVIRSGNGKEYQNILLDDYLSYYGSCEVYVKNEDGLWEEWPEASSKNLTDRVFIKTRDAAAKTTRIVFAGDSSQVPPSGQDNILIVSYDQDFAADRLIEFASALPGQCFRLDWAINESIVSPLDLEILVGNKKPGDHDYRWERWYRKDNLHSSKGGDRHYLFDWQRKELGFGNNEQGAVPGHVGNNAIKIVRCKLGCGENGNVKKNIISRMAAPFENVCGAVKNRSAVGGTRGETIEEALNRVLRDMKKQYRAVTALDYEQAALQTPGLMVARAKALPLYVKGQKGYPETREPAQVTVAVVPYSTDNPPLASEAFLSRVKQHLYAQRLITTELHVIPAQYVRIKVVTTLVVQAHIEFDNHRVIELLNQILNPIGDSSKGWPFGMTVRKADLISRISYLEGVEYVKTMTIEGDGEDVHSDKSGDVAIPPYALVYSGEHEIEVIQE